MFKKTFQRKVNFDGFFVGLDCLCVYPKLSQTTPKMRINGTFFALPNKLLFLSFLQLFRDLCTIMCSCGTKELEASQKLPLKAICSLLSAISERLDMVSSV